MKLSSYRPWVQILVAASLGLVSGYTLQSSLPSEKVPREMLLLEAAKTATTRSFAREIPIAQTLCEEFSNKRHPDADCLFPSSRFNPAATGLQATRTTDSAVARLGEQLRDWRSVLIELEKLSPASSQSDWLAASLGARINQIEDLLRPEALSYERLFHAALLSEGMRYQSISGRFSPNRWDLARIFDDREKLQARTDLLRGALEFLAVGFGLMVTLLTFVSLRRHSWSAMVLIFIGLVTLGAGLSIIADASLRFGEGSAAFAVNPFSYALLRQALSVVGCVAVGLFLITQQTLIKRLAEVCLRRITWVCVLGGLTTPMSYFLVSPAAGSETLKVWVALLASLALTRYARASYLARSIVPELWNPKKIANLIIARGHRVLFQSATALAPEFAADVIRIRLLNALGVIFSTAVLLLVITVGVFSDLGGALLSASILWALLALLFGSGVGFFALLVGGLLSLLALQTTKVANRLDLMFHPMSASISDFARLEKFREAASESGFGFGSVHWCSFEGSCLPLQSLSDYMPVLLVSTVGYIPSILVTVALAIFYITLMVIAIRGIGRYRGGTRVIFGFSFFLLLAALVQASLTFLGSFRLIPLTGLGLPMMSLGLSSLLTVLIAPALLSVATGLSRTEESLT